MTEQSKHTAEEELIINYLYGNLSDDAVRYVESLLENSDHHRAFHKKMSLIINLSDEVINTPEVNADEAFQKFIHRTEKKEVSIPSQKTKTRSLFKIGASAAAIVVFVIGVSFLFTDKDNSFKTIASTDAELSHTLEDGTVVNLHENSSFQWYVTGENERKAVIDYGSVEFTVTHNKNKPFVVQYQNFEVAVLGTTFFVETKADSLFSVFVTEGRVMVLNHSLQDSVILQKGENTTSIKRGLLSQALPNHVPEEDNTLQFSNIEISEVMQILASKYQVKIEIQDSSFAQQRLTATFRDLPVGTIMKMIEKMYGVQVVYTDDTYFFSYQ